jgi:hypothetical protein
MRAWFLVGFAFAAAALAAQAAAINPYVHQIGTDGTLRFEFADQIKHPHFWWPRTLLNYRVLFDAKTTRPERWQLTDENSGHAVPMQVSDVTIRSGQLSTATVSFFADLPLGAARSFELRTEAANAPPVASGTAAVTIDEAADSIVFDTGLMKVRLPASRTLRAGEEVPGPIVAIADSKGWMGRSTLVSPHLTPQRIATEIIDRGPLFARARITYSFANNATYAATITASLGCDFVEFAEEMHGLAIADQASVDMAWTGFTPTHRRGMEPIDQPHTIFFRGEDPHFAGPEQIENPAEEFYFRVAPYAGDNTISITSIDFTDHSNNRGLGLAVRDAAKWDDGEYSIWASSATLAIRFRYADHVLHWIWPLASGTRDMNITTYDAATAGRSIGESFQRWTKTRSEAALGNTGVAQDKSYPAFINSRYGGMSLDVVKDWQLSYPSAARRPEPVELPNDDGKEMHSIETYLKSLWNNSEAVKVEGNWVSPVALRIMSRWVVPGYLKWRDSMSPQDRCKVEALLLFHAYFASTENVSAVRHVLRGHPNFMTDWKYPLMGGAFLFPDHPLANEWADEFEKVIEIMGVFWVRPPVHSWEARGGRWTENLGTYNWAFLEPAMRANALGILFDGRDRMVSAGLALHGEYLAGVVTAPVKLGQDGVPLDIAPGTPLTCENGFERIYPPQGAHSTRRQIPNTLSALGESMLHYRPLLGEFMLWAGQRPDGSATDADGLPVSGEGPSPNHGTDPHLVSAKFTGYGIVLRAAVGTPDEISVYLQQIDKGPNYRWGFGNEGGCGDIYYYAGGKSFAGHLKEDAGDRRVTDAELTSNTGVYKDYTFRGIGMNELTEPFYDLETAQFAEILSRRGADAYSWPDYVSRSVLLVGHDYIITFDVANNMSRVSWNTIKGQDEMPLIIPIRGETSFSTSQTSVNPRMGTSESVRLEAYKGDGDRMVLVSHRHDITVSPAMKDTPEGLTEVHTPGATDFIFESRNNFAVNQPDMRFAGRVGVIRQTKGGGTELSLFHGTMIGTKGLMLTVDNPNLGISARFTQPLESAGTFFSREGGTLTVRLQKDVAALHFYVDGVDTPIKRGAGNLTASLPPGVHRWQLTTGPAEPMPPQIARSESQADGVKLFIAPVASARNYRIERSDDNGRTWQSVGESTAQQFTLSGIKPVIKIHVRAIAINQTVASRPGRDYPVYVTGQPLQPPAGLRLSLGPGEVKATWGDVLGAHAFLLHRRPAGTTQWTTVYRGPEMSVTDPAPGVIPAYADPGLEAAAARLPGQPPMIYEYAVSAVDGVGEGPLSPAANTDPSSWRNWYPDAPLKFKRQSAYWLPPYVTPEEVPAAEYPE